MTPNQARRLAAHLIRAADQADTDGADKVDLIVAFQSADDVARADLEAAIAAASAKT